MTEKKSKKKVRDIQKIRIFNRTLKKGITAFNKINNKKVVFAASAHDKGILIYK